ncbi:MAG TPA: hypothetical protein VIH42_10230 [Thermoguttaceae bacterium]
MRTFAEYNFRANAFGTYAFAGGRAAREPSLSFFDEIYNNYGLPELFSVFGIPLIVRETTNAEERNITGICSYEKDPQIPETIEERDKELLWVMVERNADRGIAEPILGMTLMRDSEDDEDTIWSYQGQIKNATGVSWELLFGRIRPRRYGMKTD